MPEGGAWRGVRNSVHFDSLSLESVVLRLSLACCLVRKTTARLFYQVRLLIVSSLLDFSGRELF
jgi:hypothetical protein